MRAKLKRRIGISALVMVLLVLSLVIYSVTNFHAVIPNKIYRSAQLPTPILVYVVKHDHIHSIINLRGENKGRPWYDKEVRVAKQLGLNHYDFRFNSQSMPTASLLMHLVQVLQSAPQPILMHCASGSDRTGMAAAVVLILDNKPLALARAQISWHYLARSKHRIGTMVLDRYAGWLGQQHLTSSRQHWLQWLSAYAQA